VFDLLHLALVHSQSLCQFDLRHLPRPPQFIERHRSDRLTDSTRHLLPALDLRRSLIEDSAMGLVRPGLPKCGI
jgi:hypothetical protein